MFIDDEGHVFNPFSVGPVSDNQRHEYKMPNAPTYPPPVFATWPPPKEHTNRSISQGSLAKRAPNDIKTLKSKMGEVSISKAINEEMAASKQLAADEERFNAGREKTQVSEIQAKDNKSHMSVTTLMPVRPRQSSSRTSLKSHVSNVSKAVSRKSVQSAAAAADKVSSKMSVHSHASRRTASNITLKQIKGDTDATKSLSHKSSHVSRKDAGANQASISRVSVKSQPKEQQEDNVSCVSRKSQADKVSIKSKADQVSIKSKTNDPQADTLSHKSIKSKANDLQADTLSHKSNKSQTNDFQADTLSHKSIKSKTNDLQADNISHKSIKSKTYDLQADNISHKSIKSKTNDLQADTLSHKSIKSKTNDLKADNISHKSIKSKASAMQAHKVSHFSIPSRANGIQPSKSSRDSLKSQNPTPYLKELADSVKKELESSMQTTKSLAEKAALIRDRLRAGNEFKHNRFHTLTRMYTNTEPVKRCRQDRMTFWFKDAVLS